MGRTIEHNNLLVDRLNEMGLWSEFLDGQIVLNRTNMCETMNAGGEQKAYDAVMNALKETLLAANINDARPMWHGRSDEIMTVVVIQIRK